MKDHPVIGEGVPMVSRDQGRINVGDTLYSGSASVDGGYNKKVELTVECTSWIVIQVNYKERYYRIRNSEGCEQSIHHGDKGCPRMKVYHQFRNLASELTQRLKKEADKTEEKLAERQLLLKEIQEGAEYLAVRKPPAAPNLIEFDAA